MLALEPTGELARPSPVGVQLLGMEVTRTRSWPALRHVFELGGRDGALFVDVGPLGDPVVYAVGYDDAFDEHLTPL